MATYIFLGKPPKYIEDWYKDADKSEDSSIDEDLYQTMLNKQSFDNFE